MLDIVLGAQFGDEGKGRIVDYLCSTGGYDTCVRVNGSDNAGHTVTVEGEKFAFNQIPIGAFHGMRCVISRGCMIDLEKLNVEIRKVEEFIMANNLPGNWGLFIDNRCHVKTQEHRDRDALEEKARLNPIGTTLSGNGPAYSDKYGRFSHRLCDVDISLYPNIESKAAILDTSQFRYTHCIVEGAHGVMLDIDHGTYPFVTSSSCTAAFACHSMGTSPKNVDRIIGVIKPYITRVGAGAFPTEILGEVTKSMIRGRGDEYGTNTKRARRIAWLDLPALSYAVRVAGITEIAICKTDIPEYLDSIFVCIGYEGVLFGNLPAKDEKYNSVRPIYETVKWGKKDAILGLLEMIGMIKKYVNVPVTMVANLENISTPLQLRSR